MKNLKTFFVYPYINSGDDFELQCSIASVRKNFKGEAVFVIIGDKPSFSMDDIIFISSERKPFRAIDIHTKLQTIINDDRIPENFVWIYDDIFFINPVNIQNLRVVYALEDMGNSGPEDWKFDASKKWIEMFKATMNIIMSEQKPVINYETHLPRFLNKTKLQKLIDKYDLLNNRLLFATLYFSECKKPVFLRPKTDNVKLGLYMPFNDIKVLESKIKDNKFLNYSEDAYTPSMKQLLINLFK